MPFYKNYLYLFGSAQMQIGGKGVNITTPLFLDRAPGDVTIFSNDLTIVPNQQTSSDTYRIGVGIDLIKLYTREIKK